MLGKRTALFLLVLAAALPASGHAQPAAPLRWRVLLDAGWRFHLASAPALQNPVAITDWRWKFEDRGQSAAAMAAPGLDTSGADWQSAKSGDDVFQGRVGFAWFRAALPDVLGPARPPPPRRRGGHPAAPVPGVDDNATVYLNGKKLLFHAGWSDPFEVTLDPVWNRGGPNVLAVRVENTNGPGGITGPVTLGTQPTVLGGNPSQPGFDDAHWRIVHLPHDFVIEQKFTPTANAGHGSLPTPMAWYRKTFALPASDRGKSLWIDFDGIYRDARVYLNGRELGEHPSGYTSFRYDISKVAHYRGKNVLAVHVDPRHFEGWWYEGGGIYRHVWLNAADPLHVAPWGTFVTSRLPEPKPGGAAAPAAVVIRTTLANTGAGAAGRLVSSVIDDTGQVVGRAAAPVSVPPGGSRTVVQQVIVSHPRLWSLEAPHLYRVAQSVERGGRAVDATSTAFGIRTIRFDPATGFYLNGKPVKIYGTCNHQDFAGVGIAVPDTLEYWRVKKLKAGAPYRDGVSSAYFWLISGSPADVAARQA